MEDFLKSNSLLKADCEVLALHIVDEKKKEVWIIGNNLWELTWNRLKE